MTTHFQAISFTLAYFAMIWLTLGLYGCSHMQGDLPRVQAQGHFTESEMREAVDSVFGPGTYLYHTTGQNVRTYTTYRAEDYEAVWRYVNARTEPWSWGWLCVQFAQEIRMYMYRAAVRSGYTEAPAAIGWFIVEQKHPWGGVPAGGRHALNVYVAGPRGTMQVWVMEPQTGIKALVGEQEEEGWAIHKHRYPNLPYVERRGVFLEL